MKISRRELGALAVTPLLAQVQVTTPAPDMAKAARDANQRNSDTLGKFEVPAGTEPAFQFKP